MKELTLTEDEISQLGAYVMSLEAILNGHTVMYRKHPDEPHYLMEVTDDGWELITQGTVADKAFESLRMGVESPGELEHVKMEYSINNVSSEYTLFLV